jgi:hypothetical protein
MADLTAQRTLVKSPPELWAELSEVESLARHLGELGEIRITKVEPETTVAWEGEQVSGTVELEQSGWGTRVTFHATVPEPETPAPEPESAAPEPEVAREPDRDAELAPVARIETASATRPFATVEFDAVAVPETEPVPAPEPATEAEAVEPKRRGFLTRWLFRPRGTVEHEIEVTAETDPVATKTPMAAEPEPIEEEPVVDAAPEPVAIEPEPEPITAEPEPEPIEPALATVDAGRVQEVLDGTLEALGQAHHRPFSRG